MSQLRLSEVFGPTVQGEGPSQGQPCVFIRLGLCNLACSWCDTPYTWDFTGRNGEAFKLADLPFTPIEEIAAEALALAGPAVRLIVISGGEPLLQSKALVELVLNLIQRGMRIEIETNGTISPPENLVGLVDFRCSPKLASAGMKAERTIHPVALAAMDAAGAAFKFVVTGPEDLDEVDALVAAHGLRDVWLMPEGRDAQTIVSRLAWVFDAAVERGWSVTPRIHVLAHNDRRAV